MPSLNKDQIKQQEPISWVADPLKAAKATMKKNTACGTSTSKWEAAGQLPALHWKLPKGAT